MKRSQKSLRKIKLLLLLMIVTMVLAITATYAWFSTQREVEITGIKLNVEVAESMQISLDGATWYQSITIDNMRQFYGTYSDTSTPQASSSTNTNYVPTELIPASTVGTVADGKLQFMTGSATMSGTTTSATLTACSEADITGTAGANDTKIDAMEDNNAEHPYLVFDMYLRNYSKDATSDELQLNAGSNVFVSSSTSNTSQEGTGVENTGLENCARVGFVIYENTADVTATSSTIVGLGAGTPQVIIWEPNAKEHIAEVIAAGRATADTANTTYGIKYNASGVTINNVYADTDDETDGSKLALQNTFKPAYTSVTSGVTEATTMTTSELTPANVTLAANKVTKVRTYIWLEGQDVDCINTASQGDRLQVNLKLTKPENTEGTQNTYEGEDTEIEIGSADEITVADYGATVTNYEASNGASVNWQIYHTDGTNIYLIADDYVPVSYVPKAKGNSIAVNTDGVYNSTYNFYLTDIVTGTAYSGTSDIASNLRTKLLSQYTYTSTAYNAKATAYLLDTIQWSGFANSYAEYAIGGPTIELFTASYNTTHTDKTIDTRVAASQIDGTYGYELKLSDEEYNIDSSTGEGYFVELNFDTIENLYVARSNEKAYGHWVASPSAYNTDYVMAAEYNEDEGIAELSNTNYNNNEIGARPIASKKLWLCLLKTNRIREVLETNHVL